MLLAIESGWASLYFAHAGLPCPRSGPCRKGFPPIARSMKKVIVKTTSRIGTVQSKRRSAKTSTGQRDARARAFFVRLPHTDIAHHLLERFFERS